MRTIVYHRHNVLRSLAEVVADVSGNVYISTLPPAVDEQETDRVLIKLLTITDRGDTYQTATARIYVFARDIAAVYEDTQRLDEMQQKVTRLFPIVTELYHAKSPILLPGGSDGTGFHSLIIQFSITIFKKPNTKNI